MSEEKEMVVEDSAELAARLEKQVDDLRLGLGALQVLKLRVNPCTLEWLAETSFAAIKLHRCCQEVMQDVHTLQLTSPDKRRDHIYFATICDIEYEVRQIKQWVSGQTPLSDRMLHSFEMAEPVARPVPTAETAWPWWVRVIGWGTLWLAIGVILSKAYTYISRRIDRTRSCPGMSEKPVGEDADERQKNAAAEFPDTAFPRVLGGFINEAEARDRDESRGDGRYVRLVVAGDMFGKHAAFQQAERDSFLRTVKCEGFGLVCEALREDVTRDGVGAVG